MHLKALVPPRAALTWLGLLALSLLGPGLGVGGTATTLAILTIAVIKVRLVGLDFMELRHAPMPMRAGFEGYCVVLWCMLTGMHTLL